MRVTKSINPETDKVTVGLMYDGVEDLRNEGNNLKCKRSHNKEQHERLEATFKTKQNTFRTKTKKQVDELLEQGWLDNLGKISGITKKVKEIVNMDIPDRRRKRRRCDTHGEVDTDRLLAARMDGLFQRKIRVDCKAVSPVVNIIMEWGANAGITEEKLFWSAVAPIVTTQLLEEAGYRVNLLAVWTNEVSPRNVGAIVAKRPEQALRLADLSALLAMPATFRTYGFLSLVQACDISGNDIPPGLGHATRFNMAELERTFPEIKAEDTYPCAAAFSRDAATAEVNKAIEHFTRRAKGEIVSKSMAK